MITTGVILKTSTARDNTELSWARDVIAVYQSQGCSTPKSWSNARKSLFRWVGEEDNINLLYSNLVPKAIEVLAKHDKVKEEGEIEKSEKKSVQELRFILKTVLESSEA
jgi:hypothetical protein